METSEFTNYLAGSQSSLPTEAILNTFSSSPASFTDQSFPVEEKPGSEWVNSASEYDVKPDITKFCSVLVGCAEIEYKFDGFDSKPSFNSGPRLDACIDPSKIIRTTNDDILQEYLVDMDYDLGGCPEAVPELDAGTLEKTAFSPLPDYTSPVPAVIPDAEPEAIAETLEEAEMEAEALKEAELETGALEVPVVIPEAAQEVMIETLEKAVLSPLPDYTSPVPAVIPEAEPEPIAETLEEAEMEAKTLKEAELKAEALEVPVDIPEVAQEVMIETLEEAALSSLPDHTSPISAIIPEAPPEAMAETLEEANASPPPKYRTRASDLKLASNFRLSSTSGVDDSKASKSITDPFSKNDFQTTTVFMRPHIDHYPRGSKSEKFRKRKRSLPSSNPQTGMSKRKRFGEHWRLIDGDGGHEIIEILD